MPDESGNLAEFIQLIGQIRDVGSKVDLLAQKIEDLEVGERLRDLERRESYVRGGLALLYVLAVVFGAVIAAKVFG